MTNGVPFSEGELFEHSLKSPLFPDRPLAWLSLSTEAHTGVRPRLFRLLFTGQRLFALVWRESLTKEEKPPRLVLHDGSNGRELGSLRLAPAATPVTLSTGEEVAGAWPEEVRLAPAEWGKGLGSMLYVNAALLVGLQGKVLVASPSPSERAEKVWDRLQAYPTLPTTPGLVGERATVVLDLRDLLAPPEDC